MTAPCTVLHQTEIFKESIRPMQLNPQHVTIDELLSGRLFRIPDYQRAYSWQAKQRVDLFNDIEEVAQSGFDHFMATVVGLGRESCNIGSKRYKIVDLVDGQQRITTIVILLKAIEQALDNEHTERDKRDLGELLIKDDEHSVVLLQTNHDSSDVFLQYVRTGRAADTQAPTASDQNVIDAIAECEAFVANWVESRPLVELLSTIRNKLSLIYHEIADEAVVYRVFEVLNSRGLDVKWVDKTKSRLMALIYEHVPDSVRQEGLHEMHTIWKDVYRTLGLDLRLGDEALAFAGTWKLPTSPRRVLSEEDASIEIANAAGDAIRTIMDAARWLRRVVNKVVSLDNDRRRSAVARVRQARFVAVAILLRGFEEETERDLLAAWERVTFRIYTLGGADTRKRVGEYVELGYEIINAVLEPTAIKQRLLDIGHGYSIDEVIDEDGSTWEEWYGGWSAEVRYLLFRYEEHLAKEKGEHVDPLAWEKIWAADPAKSIEHITPRSSKEPWVHHLGNLTMLPPRTNSKLSDKPPAEKAATYVEGGVKATAAVGRELLQGIVWDEEAAKRRAADIEKFVRVEWGE